MTAGRTFSISATVSYTVTAFPSPCLLATWVVAVMQAVHQSADTFAALYAAA
ncbi:hypothetical protein [Actinomadura sp. 6N118]|uniref:hypothetical protein n=1 Tax=Actinomadura sp. 6N118 TaxID=3375151 RepID=UPI00378CB473